MLQFFCLISYFFTEQFSASLRSQGANFFEILRSDNKIGYHLEIFARYSGVDCFGGKKDHLEPSTSG